jgi:hypothetical protein
VADLSRSKSLILGKHGHASLHWYGVPVRIFLLTFIGTLLSFAVSLLIAILCTVVVWALRGVRPDMTFAYWHVALPAALVASVIIFVAATILEIRHYQQRKMLNAIERMG